MALDADDGQLDLTPRAVDSERVARRGGAAKWRNLVLIGLIVAGLGFVVTRGLGNATLFFKNVDEAVAERDELGTRRFRLQGSVVPSTIDRTGEGAVFEVEYDGVRATVRHVGDLPQLFQPDIPVVLEGSWMGTRFESDRMLVKHSEVYEAENPTRLDADPANDDPASDARP